MSVALTELLAQDLVAQVLLEVPSNLDGIDLRTILPQESWEQSFPNLTHGRSLILIKDRNYLNTFRRSWELCEAAQRQQLLASIVLGADRQVAEELKALLGASLSQALLLVAKPLEIILVEMSRLLHTQQQRLINQCSEPTQIHPTAMIHSGVYLAPGVKIGAHCVVHHGCSLAWGSELGEGVELFPQVVLYPNTHIGEGSRIHAHTVLGSDGFGYFFYQGKHRKIWHVGGVRIGRQVEIGAGVTVDSGTFTPTVIGDGCIIDNQVQVAHNVHLGEGVVLCGQSGIAGSAQVGAFSLLGGRAAVAPSVRLGAQTQVAAGGMVTKNWPEKSQLGGHPARELKDWLRAQAAIQSLVKKKS